jgi:hypothetical protein
MRWQVCIALGALASSCGTSSEQAESPAPAPASAAAPAPASTPAPSSVEVVPVPPHAPDGATVEAAPIADTKAAAPPDGVQTKPAPAEPGADGKSFTVVARLVDRGRSTPHCGVIHAVAVMKLEVVRVEDGRFAGDTLHVYVSCPEMLPSSTVRRLEVGTSYRIVLDTRIHRRTAGAKFDAFGEDDAPRYRLMRVETVEA